MKTPRDLVAEYSRYRDQLNPLRGLTIARAVTLLESMYAGDMADLQWTYAFIEETDPDLLALVERRTSAIDEMDYTIKTASEEKHPRTWDEKLAEDQRATLGAAYERIDNIYEAIVHLAMATFRKYAHLQTHVDPDGAPVHLEPLDQWNWVRQGSAGAWYWNPDARQTTWQTLGEPIDPVRDRLIVREVNRHVNRYGLVKFIRSNLSEKDWDGFIDLYGIPKWLIIEPADVSETDRPKWRRAAADLAGGGSLPHGSDAKPADPERSVHPFQPRLEWLQKQLILAGTGGLLTMLSAPGSGTLAGGAHMETFKILARSEARRISELFQRTLDRMVLENDFPGKPRLAYFSLVANEEQDIDKIVKHATDMRNAGMPMDEEQFEEKSGYRLSTRTVVAGTSPAPTAPATHRAMHAAAGGNRRAAAEALGDSVDTQLRAAARDALARAFHADLAPLRARLERALALDDDAAMLADLQSIPAELPGMLAQIIAAPAAEQVLQETLAAALVNGLVEGAVAHAPTTTTEAVAS